MSKKSFKTINGINGINIKKVVKFAFYINPISYYFDEHEKTFIYLMPKSIFEGDENARNREVKKYFEDFWCVKIKPI